MAHPRHDRSRPSASSCELRCPWTHKRTRPLLSTSPLGRPATVGQLVLPSAPPRRFRRFPLLAWAWLGSAFACSSERWRLEGPGPLHNAYPRPGIDRNARSQYIDQAKNHERFELRELHACSFAGPHSESCLSFHLRTEQGGATPRASKCECLASRSMLPPRICSFFLRTRRMSVVSLRQAHTYQVGPYTNTLAPSTLGTRGGRWGPRP